MANLDSLDRLDLQSGLYSLEAQAALCHQGVQAMLPRSLHENLFDLAAHAGQADQ